MGKNADGKYHFEVLAIITLDKNRVMGGKQLTLLAENEEQLKSMAEEVALILKGDVVKLKFGDYLIVRT